MGDQIELIKELQVSEYRRFRGVDEIYRVNSRNPVGMRFSDLERAFNVASASKLVGWPEGVDSEAFLTSACDVVRDYISGPYIAELPDAYRAEFENPRQAESWFDFAQVGFYLAFIAKHTETAHAVSEWLMLDMKEDSGIEEVSPAINVLYEHIACVLRGEAIPRSFAERYEAGVKRERERYLADMLVAVEQRDERRFLDALDMFLAKWRRNRSTAYMSEVISVDASSLCGVWQSVVGTSVIDDATYDSVHVVW